MERTLEFEKLSEVDHWAPAVECSFEILCRNDMVLGLMDDPKIPNFIGVLMKGEQIIELDKDFNQKKNKVQHKAHDFDEEARKLFKKLNLPEDPVG